MLGIKHLVRIEPAMEGSFQLRFSSLLQPTHHRPDCEPHDPEGGVRLAQSHPVQLARHAPGPLVEQDVAACRVLRDEVFLLA